MTDPTDGNPPSDTERHNAKMARKKSGGACCRLLENRSAVMDLGVALGKLEPTIELYWLG